MCAVSVPASAGEALGMLESALRMQQAALVFLAEMDTADVPATAAAGCLHLLEQSDAVGAAARGQLLAIFDAQDGSVADGQRTARAWLVHVTGVTRGQAAEHKAVQALAEGHPVLLAGLRERAVSKSVALQLAKWTRAIPEECREEAEEILVAAARAGADLRALAAICAEIRSRTAEPDSDDQDDRHLDRGVSFDTTFEGAGVIRGDLTPECAARASRLSWTPCPPRPAAATCAPTPSGTTTRSPKPCGGWSPAACSPNAPGSPSRPSSTSTSASCSTWTRTPSCRTRGSASTGPGGPPAAPPLR